MVILATLIVGFAFSFHALFAQSREEVPGFRNIISSMFTTYSLAVFGDVDSDSYEHSASPTIMIVLVMGLQVFILIVMMNGAFCLGGFIVRHLDRSCVSPVHSFPLFHFCLGPHSFDCDHGRHFRAHAGVAGSVQAEAAGCAVCGIHGYDG